MALLQAEPSPTSTAVATKVRYLVLALVAFGAASAYLTRIMGAAATTIQDEFGCSSAEIGHILAGFFLGYFWFQIPGGWLGNRWGPRGVLAAMGLLWSAATFWVSQAPSGDSMRYARIALGISQAGLMPCIALVLAAWIPLRDRGRASSLVAISMQVGAVAATGLTAQLVEKIGWRTTFGLYASTGIVWGGFFLVLFRNRPEEHPWSNAAERALIRGTDDARNVAQPSAVPRADALRLGQILRMSLTLCLWAVCLQAFFRAFAYEIYYSWFPALLEKGYGVARVDAGYLAVIPQVAGGAGCLLGGWAVDGLWRATGSKRISRSGTAVLALGLTAALTQAATMTSSVTAVVALLSLGAFTASLAGPAAWAATIDLAGPYTGVLFGLMNMAGNMGAYACPIVVGGLVDKIEHQQGDWSWVLSVFVAVNLACALSWLILNPNRPLVEVEGEGTRPPSGRIGPN